MKNDAGGSSKRSREWEQVIKSLIRMRVKRKVCGLLSSSLQGGPVQGVKKVVR